MTTNPMMHQQTSLKDIDFIYYIRHYARLFWKWRLYIIIVAPLAAIVSGLIVLKMGLLKRPPLTVTTIIGLDNPKKRNMDDFSISGQNNERLFYNRGFIYKIVNNLSLQLVISDHSRYDIFDSVSVDSTAAVGLYEFKIDKKNINNYTLLFTNQAAGIKGKVIESGTISTLQRLSVQGMYLKFAEVFLKDPQSFTFSVLAPRFAIDRILGRLKVINPNFQQDRYYITLSLEGTDYPLITQVVNSMSDLFIAQNLENKKKRMSKTLEELERQLGIAEQQSSLSKSTLKAFLAQNPSVGLSQGTQQSMAELIALETGSYESNANIEDAQTLKDKWKNAPADEKVPILNEIIVFLQIRGNIAAPSLQSNLTQVIAEKESALNNYAKSHPIFSEIETKMNAINSRALQALDTYIAQQKRTIAERNMSMQKITSKLHGLPSQELQLAELQKKQEIDNDIYSKILTRYNEAKVSVSVENSEYYVMEYALQPFPPSKMQQYLQCLGIVLVCTLLFGIGPAIGFDIIDKTARSEQELAKLLPYRFLESIPKITMPKTEKSKQIQPYEGEILINTPDLQPASAIELFRSLTTKIQLDYYDNPDKSMVVTSLEMNEGKSTVAANLAISFAEYGVKTVLIDCDLRRGVAHKILNVKKSPGLSDYLFEKIKGQSITIQLPLQPTTIQNLSIIPAGQLSDNPQKLLQCAALAELKKELQENNYFVIFDSPPIGVTADSAILSNIVSKYLFVIRSGTTNVVKLRKIIHKDYPMIEKKVIGSVLNMCEDDVPKKYYSYYYNNARISKRSQSS